MEKILQELREIKDLLRIIASNTEQKMGNNLVLSEALTNCFNHLNQELHKEFHKET